MLKLKLQYFGHRMQRTDSLEKDPDAGKDWRWEEKGMTENEMVGWHHWLDGHECEQAQGVGDGQGSLACCSPWGCKETDMTEWLNWLNSQIEKSLSSVLGNSLWSYNYMPCFPGSSAVKNLPFNARDSGSIPGLGRSPGEGNGNPFRILACRAPWTEEPGRLQSIGSQSQTRLKWLSMSAVIQFSRFSPHSLPHSAAPSTLSFHLHLLSRTWCLTVCRTSSGYQGQPLTFWMAVFSRMGMWCQVTICPQTHNQKFKNHSQILGR